MRLIIQELTTYLRGWINYFGVAKGYQTAQRYGGPAYEVGDCACAC